MLISIVIPTFNAEKTIATCLSSIALQTFKDYEVLIIDGGSADATVKMAHTFVPRLPMLRIFSESDKGIYDAMNKAVGYAEGSWLYFLGSDDSFFSIDVLEKIASAMAETQIDVVYGDITSPRFNGNYGGPFSAARILFQNISHQAIFLNKRIFKQIGFFDLQYKAHADWDHNMRWLLNPMIKKVYTPLIIANYADGGYSSVHGDEVFQKIKLFKYLRY